MDANTFAAMQLYRPSLEATLHLLRAAERESPDSNPGFGLLLEARAELEQVFGCAVEVEEERRAATHAAELQHLLTKTRMLAQAAAEQTGRAVAMLVAAADKGEVPAAALRELTEGLVTANYGLATIDTIARTGVCGCRPADCAYAVQTKPLAPVTKPAPIRKSAGPFVKPRLVLVKTPAGES